MIAEIRSVSHSSEVTSAAYSLRGDPHGHVQKVIDDRQSPHCERRDHDEDQLLLVPTALQWSEEEDHVEQDQ